MQHHFDTAIACKFGMLEAVIINHFEFWLEHNEKNGRNFYDGRYWTFNSMRAFAEIFPYVSERKIRNALKHLEEEGILITGNYNKSTYDRTLWYAFSDLGKSILQKCQMEDAEMSNGNCKNVKPIPDNKQITDTDDVTDNNHKSSAKPKEPVIYYPLDDKLNQAVIDFIEFRKKIKSPMTDKAITIMVNSLDKMTDDNNEKIAILEQSIMNGWKGVFPLDKRQKKASSNPFAERLKQMSDDEDCEELIF